MSKKLRKESAEAAGGKTSRAASPATTKKASKAAVISASKTAAPKATAKTTRVPIVSATKTAKRPVAKVPAKAATKPASKAVSSSKAVARAAPKTVPRAPVKKALAKPTAKTDRTPATKAVASPKASKAAKPAAATRKRKIETDTIVNAEPTISESGTAAGRTSTPRDRIPDPLPVAEPAAAPLVSAPAIATEGLPAPGFRLPRDGGALVSLADYAGQKLVIFFYPRANTPGCTKEAIEFTRLSPDFAEAETAVLGVSADPLKTQESFRDKYELATPLLSDTTHAMLKAYAAWGEKSMYGKTFEGVLRTTVLINREGTIVKIWRNVKVDGHADVVLDAARQI